MTDLVFECVKVVIVIVPGGKQSQILLVGFAQNPNVVFPERKSTALI